MNGTDVDSTWATDLLQTVRTSVVWSPAVTTTHVRAATLDDIPKCWPFIRDALLRIKRRQRHQSGWTPQHVHAALMAGRAELWLSFLEECLVGFTVTQVLLDPFLNAATGLFVWFAHKDPHIVCDAIPAMDAFLERVARDRGYEYLEALTARKGLARRLERYGWRGVLEVVRKELY